MLIVQNLSVSLENKSLLTDVTFTLRKGEWHALTGANGSGKSSLLQALMGHPSYKVEGLYTLNNEDIAALSVEQRARRGIFLAFQQPLAMPGIKVITFFHRAFCILSQKEMGMQEFRILLEDTLQEVGLAPEVADRFLHDGFSGGERKRLELAQLLLFPISVALLDELDSGLDAHGISLLICLLDKLRQKKPHMMALVVSHSPEVIRQLKVHSIYHVTHNTLLVS